MNYHPIFDCTGLGLVAVIVTGSVLIGILLAGPSLSAEAVAESLAKEQVAAPGAAKTATEKAAEYVDTAKATEDGTVHPRGIEAKPREQWFSPCPPDRKITKSGECVGMDEAGAAPDEQK